MSKVRVLILQDIKGVDDGDLYPKEFKEGKEYDIGKDLYEQFAILKVVETNSKKQNEEDDSKMDSKDYENKMEEKEYSNKSNSGTKLKIKSIRKKGGKS